MTLLELLVKELPARGGWPEGVNCISTHADGMVFHDGSIQSYRFNIFCSDGWKPGKEHGYTNAVSKNQYEAAIKQSGWIEWHGGKCPVETGMLVDVRYRDGEELYSLPANKAYPGMRDAQAAFWRNEGRTNDIVAYRLSESEWNGEGLPPVGTRCEWQDKNTKAWLPVIVVYASEWVTVIREADKTDAVEIAIENYGDEARRQFIPIRTEAYYKREDATEFMLKVCTNYNKTDVIHAVGEIYDAIIAHDIPGVTTVPNVGQIMRATESCSREDAQKIVDLLNGA